MRVVQESELRAPLTDPNTEAKENTGARFSQILRAAWLPTPLVYAQLKTLKAPTNSSPL